MSHATSTHTAPAPAPDAALEAAHDAFLADFAALIARPWPERAIIRAGTAIAGLAPARRVPGQTALSARHMPRPAAGRAL